jgi:hypothetical protein
VSTQKHAHSHLFRSENRYYQLFRAEVQQEDIDDAVRKSPTKCVLANTLKRTLKVHKVYIQSDGVWVQQKEGGPKQFFTHLGQDLVDQAQRYRQND